MSKKHHSPQSRPSTLASPWLPGGGWIVGFGLVALSISGYLLWGALRGAHLPGCGPDSGCDVVLASRWSRWLGIPVSLGAVLTYAVLLCAVFFGNRNPGGVRADRSAGFSQSLLAGLGLVLVGAAIWFIALQFFVLHAICPFCMVAHVCGLIVGVLLLRTTSQAPQARPAFGLASAALLLFVAGQILHRPASFQVSSIGEVTQDPPGPSPAESGRLPAAEDPIGSTPPDSAAAPQPRRLQIHDGLFELDLQATPLVGSPLADHVVLHFFDYTCEHCRELHEVLAEAHRALGDRLALVQLPVPLEPDCNPIMKRPNPKHLNACAHAKLGLAVWLAKPEELAAYEDWVFGPAKTPEPEAARAEAARRVGTNALTAALEDPWIDDYLAFSIRLYHTNYLRYRKSQLPLMMIGSNLVSGVIGNTNDLYRLLGVTVPSETE